MSDLSTKLLESIRDELTNIGRRVVETNERLDVTNARLDRLERRQTETEIRLATELTAVVGAIGDLKNAILEDRQLRATVLDHEARLRALETA